MEISEWWPMSPAEGPPLPGHFKIYWPWYKLPTETPTEPTAPTEPTTPTEPTMPTEPTAPTEPVAPSTASLFGTVTDEDTGGLIANATVEIGGNNTTSDQSGMYSLTGLPTGDCIVVAGADGYQAYQMRITLVVGDNTHNITLPKVETLTGLKIKCSGMPEVWVGYGLQFSATLTKADGTIQDVTNDVRLTWVSSDPDVATISNQGSALGVATGTTVISAAYQQLGYSGVSLTSNSITLNVVPKAAPPGPGDLTGKVTDGNTGASLSGVTVATYNTTAKTDARGAYAIKNLPPGGYSVTFSKAGYQTKTLPVGIFEGTATTLDAIMSTAAATVTPTITLSSPSVHLRQSPRDVTISMKGFQYDPTGVMNTTHTANYMGVTYEQPDHTFPRDNYLAIFFHDTELAQVPMSTDGSGSYRWTDIPSNPGNHVIMVTDVFGNSASAPITIVYP